MADTELDIWEATVTTAPEAFDGFGTLTVRRGQIVSMSGYPTPCRMVLTPVLHLAWQRQRYGSGMYVNLAPSTFAERFGAAPEWEEAL